MKKLVILVGLLTLVACGKKTETIIGEPGKDGKDGISTGVEILQSANGCSNGGITIKTYLDYNVNSSLDLDEPVKQTAVVCNGVDGQDGQDGADGQDGQDGQNGSNGQDGTSVIVRTATASECPNGGVAVNDTPICNGADGSMGPQGQVGAAGPQGPQGAQGPQGIQGEQGEQGEVGPQGPVGPAGQNGSVGNVTPVQLCPGDNASFKEYGVIMNGELYAVYHNNSAGYTFFSKLKEGNYITTNGSNCTFRYENDGDYITLSNNNGEFEVELNQDNDDNNNASGQLSFVDADKTYGSHNNAEVEVFFENNSNFTVTKFQVIISGLDSYYIRSGSSLTGPYGNVDSYTSNTITFNITSGGLAPGQTVSARILLNKLNASKNLNFEAYIK